LDFIKLANEIGELVQEKNQVYGDSFARAGEILKILYPRGIEPSQYRDVLAITRILDKLFRIATARDALGESPYRDLMGYALLGLANAEAKQETTTPAEQFKRDLADVRQQRKKPAI